MVEIVYKLFFFMILVIIVSFAFLAKQKVVYYKQFHWLDFISIDHNFKISTWWVSFKTRNIVYVRKYPNECKNNNKNSIKCLSALKNQIWVYNWLSFFSWTNIYK